MPKAELGFTQGLTSQGQEDEGLGRRGGAVREVKPSIDLLSPKRGRRHIKSGSMEAMLTRFGSRYQVKICIRRLMSNPNKREGNIQQR